MSTATADSEQMHALDRVLAWHVVEFILDELARLTEHGDGDHIRSLIEMAINQATRPIHDVTPGCERTISVRAIAASLGLSYETCRRKVRELVAAGRCQKVDPSHLVMTQGFLDTSAYEADCEARWRNLRAHLVALREIGFDFEPFRNVSSQTVVRATTLSRSVAALIDDFMLRLIEARINQDDDIIDSNIITAMMNMNGAPVRRDRDLTWKYAAGETPPPDSDRAPVTVALIARRLKMGEDSVRRRVKAYVQRGWVQRVRGGYLFAQAQQLTPEAHRSRYLVNQRFLQLVQALRRLGVDPATVTAD